MMRAALAGLAYFTLVFAAGFGLGTLRVLALAPILGEGGAVLLELPIILAIAWMACRWIDLASGPFSSGGHMARLYVSGSRHGSQSCPVFGCTKT